MTKSESKKYLVEHEHIQPDTIIKKRKKYRGFEVFNISWKEHEGKDIGLPFFYLVNENNEVFESDSKQTIEILNWMENRIKPKRTL